MQARYSSKPSLQIYDEALLGIKPKALSIKLSRQEQADARVDALEDTILKKAEILSGFADGNGKARYFLQTLKFFDKKNLGYISFPDFLDVLQKFNLMNLSREAEELFNRYDADMLGHVDCRDLAHRLYRVPPHNRVVLSAAGKSTVFALRAALASRGWEAGVRYVRKALQLASLDAEEHASLQEVVEKLCAKTERTVSKRAFIALLLELTRRREDGKVDVGALIDALKSYMELSRKRLIRTVFDKIDTEGRGYISEDDVAAHYRAPSPPSPHHDRFLPSIKSSVASAGAAEAETAQGALELMRRAQRQQRVAGVTWAAFLDFHRCLSMAIDSDAEFQRRVWDLWGGAAGHHAVLTMPSVGSVASSSLGTLGSPRGIARPMTAPVALQVTVKHLNGTETSVQLPDDLSMLRYSTPSLEQQLAKRGVRNIHQITW
eukprot:gene25238-30480_t